MSIKILQKKTVRCLRCGVAVVAENLISHRSINAQQLKTRFTMLWTICFSAKVASTDW